MVNPGVQSQSGELIPRVPSSTEGTLVQVRATEGLAAAQVLENFPLEEILKYLDSRGYEVDLRLKTIVPISDEGETTP
jgi:hypothetical protein